MHTLADKVFKKQGTIDSLKQPQIIIMIITKSYLYSQGEAFFIFVLWEQLSQSIIDESWLTKNNFKGKEMEYLKLREHYLPQNILLNSARMAYCCSVKYIITEDFVLLKSWFGWKLLDLGGQNSPQKRLFQINCISSTVCLITRWQKR